MSFLARLVLVVVAGAQMVSPVSAFSQCDPVWVRKVAGGGLGDPFAYNPQNHNTIFSAPGNNQIWRSTDRGRNWTLFSTVSGGNQIKSICVHPIDTLQMIVGQEAGPPDRVMKTTNGGQSWFFTWGGNYSFYGRPLAYDPAHPELVYVAGGDSLFRSDDFGSTWTFVRRTNNAGGASVGFNAWDCAVIRPDSSMILYVGDVGNGLWKSTDGGLTWSRKHLHSGEYPIIAIDRFNPLIAYSARWGGVRGFMKTTDGGETWVDVAPLAGRNTWGAAVTVEHSGYVYTGTYSDPLGSTGGVYISSDYGQTWTRTFQGLTSGSNYGVMALDSLSVFALQANGIWKLWFPGTARGVVFHDLNGNGNQDPGEPGIENVQVRLAGGRIDSILTDAGGWYQFARLCSAAYSISLDLPPDWNITSPPAGNYTFTVIDGDQFRERNFGVVPNWVSVSVPLLEGWNLISNPVTREAGTDSLLQLFPNSVFPYSFGFLPSVGYVQHHILQNAIGYWAKFPQAKTNTIVGPPRTTDSVSVHAGWNVVGSISYPVDVSTITTNPPDIVASSWFGYAGGYFVATSIEPGHAYWIKTNAAGTLYLANGLQSRRKERTSP